MKKLKALLKYTEATITIKEYEEIVLTLFNYRKLSSNSKINISEENSFSHWINLGISFHMDNVVTSFHALLRKNPDLNPKDYVTIQTCLHKLGNTTLKQTKILRNAIWILNDIPLDTPTKDVFKIFKKRV